MEDSEQQWVQAIRSGDREAFREVFFTYYEDLHAFATKHVGCEQYASDVVQEVFLKVWKTRSQWTIHTSLKAYLYRAVRNRSLNEDRRRDNKQQFRDRLEQTRETAQRRTAHDQLCFEAMSHVVKQAIVQLPERQRMVFLLHRRHGFTYAEIAEIIEITPKTVESHMGRALKFLRSEIKSELSISI